MQLLCCFSTNGKVRGGDEDRGRAAIYGRVVRKGDGGFPPFENREGWANLAINPNAEGDFIIDPSGKYLYLTIGFGGPDAFVIFNIDSTTGALTPNLNSPVAGGQAPFALAIGKY